MIHQTVRYIEQETQHEVIPSHEIYTGWCLPARGSLIRLVDDNHSWHVLSVAHVLMLEKDIQTQIVALYLYKVPNEV